MDFQSLVAPARLLLRARFLIAPIVAVAFVSAAMAQTAPTQPAPRPSAPKQQPKKPAQPQAQPARPAPAPQQQAATPGEQQMPIVYSPWTKFCGKDKNQTAAKEVCLTVKEARLETGQFVAGAALIEQEGEAKKVLRITLPLGMQLVHGTRMILDKEQPMLGRYVVCLPNGCMADFEVDGDFVTKLKKGEQIVLQGINLPGQAASYPLPLVDFAKANDGPATDPKVFEEQQRKLQEELQRKAEEARKKLQDQQSGTTPPAQPR
jgi:invasion protein IalB